MTSALFAATVFLSAALLFVVQPMTGKQLLPLAGGTPAVWTTCLLFFQAALLLGYLYAHRLARLPVGRQLAAHLGVMAGGLALALALGRLKPDPALVPDAAAAPVFWLVVALAACVGGPFIVLAATAPLAQNWFAAAGGRDPYPLYAASNAGSLLGLLGYPLLVEPALPLPDQRDAWVCGFAACLGLIAACGWRAAGRYLTPQPPSLGGKGEPEGNSAPSSSPPPRGEGPGEGFSHPLHWVGLAALTSSLLMSVTTHLTTDVAPVPLLWVVPLALYLATFIVTFARWPAALHRLVARVTPMALCALAVALATRATDPPALAAAVHLGAFTLVCLLAHGELARLRPPADRLTRFYLWVSVGGVLGGAFNAVLAPVLFARLGPVEYPLAVVLAALVRPGWAPTRLRWDDLAAPAAFGGVAAGLVLGVPAWLGDPPKGDPAAELLDRVLRGGVTFGLPAAAAFALAWRPVRFALALGAVLLAGSLDRSRGGETLAVVRDFFGTLRVTRTDDGFVRLWHGTTQHGMQRADDRADPAPRMYYHRRGPLGRYFAAVPPDRLARVGVVGLGSGATAAYARPGQSWAFYEISPAVIRLAEDERFFTYLSACRARGVAVEVVPGDARRQLTKDPAGSFDLLVLDAFSSDAIPVHLLTAEAFRLYLDRLGPRGVLAFHLSNRYLDLPPLVARLAADADPSLVVRLDEDGAVTDGERADGKSPSAWLFVARRFEDLGPKRVGLTDVRPLAGPGWTDDFSNLLGVWKRREED